MDKSRLILVHFDRQMTEDELMNLLCPLGGDETNDCADCAYAGDYHFVDGKCVRRDD